MARSSTAPKTRGKVRNITVMHTDLRAFCEFNTGLKPTEMAALMDTYYKVAGTIVRDEGGTIDKFIGDTVLALFNAETSLRQPEAHAVNAALRLKEEIAERWPHLPISIGIASGPAVVGQFGPSFKREFTAFGDVVGRARILERRSHNTGFKILVDETTREKLPVNMPVDSHPRVEHPTVNGTPVFEVSLAATTLKPKGRK